MDDIKHILDTFSALKNQRHLYHTEWEELSEIFSPGMQNFVTHTKPWKKRNNSIDGHAPYYAQKLTSYLFGQATNPATKFVKFDVADFDVKLTKSEQLELDELNRRVLRTFASSKSNFASSIQEALFSSIIFGPGALYIDNQLGRDIKFKALPLSQIYFSENDAGHVDTLFREFKFSAKQLVQAFGKENVSEKVRTCLVSNPEEMFTVLHCTYPNMDSKKTKDKYLSYYIELDTNHILEKQELSSFNFIVFRWSKHIGEKYGHGQGKLALTAIRHLSHIRRENAKSLSFNNNPVMLTADDGVIIPESITPGMVIQGAMSSLDGQRRLEMWNPGGNSQAGLALYEQEKDLLAKLFFAEDLNLPVDRTRRTATEVSIMRNDQIRFLTPHMARLTNELLKPMAELVVQLLAENGEFDDFETDILNYELEPDFLGPLSQLLKFEDVRATQQFLQSILPLAEIDNSILESIDFQKIVEDTRQGTGTPSHVMRSEEEVESIRQQKAAAQQQQMAMQSALASSEVSKNLGQANKYNEGV